MANRICRLARQANATKTIDFFQQSEFAILSYFGEKEAKASSLSLVAVEVIIGE